MDDVVLFVMGECGRRRLGLGLTAMATGREDLLKGLLNGV